MIRMFEKAGAKLLEVFVPRAAAEAATCYAYPQCWQCNKNHGGPCNYNGSCAVCSGVIICDIC